MVTNSPADCLSSYGFDPTPRAPAARPSATPPFPPAMTDEAFFRAWDAELRRIGIHEDATDYFGFDGSWGEIIAQLRRIPSGVGADGFFQIVQGRDFTSWKQELDSEHAIYGEAI